MLRDLLVPIFGSDADAASVAAGIALANAYAAHFVGVMPAPCLTASQAPWGMTSPGLIDALIEEQTHTTRAHLGALRERLLLQRVESWDVRTETSRLAVPGAAAAMQARHADLSVMRAPGPGEPDDREAEMFHALLFESGRPVLVVPARGDITAPFRKVVAAWKNTKEATRALHDAVTLFAPNAIEVLVVDHPDESAEAPGASMAAHLARYGAHVEVAMRRSNTKSIATTVLLQAAEQGADLVVAGGYGHSRVREWVLGGTTRDLLRHVDIPILFSH